MSRLTEAFLDTAFAIALSSPQDSFHEKALALAEQLELQQTKLVTTRAVVLEIGNALGKQRYRRQAVALLESLQQDPLVEIHPLSEELFHRSFELYRSRQDKEWGLIDCISFVVMFDQGITAALTTDEHFQQAGFQVLLKET